MTQSENAPKTLVPKPVAAVECGVSSRTVSRWIADANVGFPKPVRIKRNLYFARNELEAWKNSRS
jgi:predicted DNA-binding transcriptional regulator AlpA